MFRKAAVFDTAPGDLVIGTGTLDTGAPLRLHVEYVSSRTMIGYEAAWADLAARALESNVFLEPAFALPLIQHAERARPPRFLLVWAESHAVGFSQLIGLLPLARDAWPHPFGVLRCFADRLTVGGVPLLDKASGASAMAAMLAWLREREPKARALLVRGVALDGAFATTLARSGAVYDVQCGRERAILRRIEPCAPVGGLVPRSTFLSAKRRKELRRQRRRLSEIGERCYTSARTPGEIAKATERFLSLEHRGWKGKRGTALLASAHLATFTRTMTRLMACEGKCRIDAIEIDGRAVAMGIILTVAGRAHFWKTAFDETYANRSPGVQFALDLTQAQLADDSVWLTDSCAVPDHPMIDRLWPERMPVGDLLIALRPDDTRGFRRVVALQRLSSALHDASRDLYKFLRGRTTR